MSILSNFGSIFALFHLYIIHMFYEPLEEKVRLIEQSKMPDFKRKKASEEFGVSLACICRTLKTEGHSGQLRIFLLHKEIFKVHFFP